MGFCLTGRALGGEIAGQAGMPQATQKVVSGLFIFVLTTRKEPFMFGISTILATIRTRITERIAGIV